MKYFVLVDIILSIIYNTRTVSISLEIKGILKMAPIPANRNPTVNPNIPAFNQRSSSQMKIKPIDVALGCIGLAVAVCGLYKGYLGFGVALGVASIGFIQRNALKSSFWEFRGLSPINPNCCPEKKVKIVNFASLERTVHRF